MRDGALLKVTRATAGRVTETEASSLPAPSTSHISQTSSFFYSTIRFHTIKDRELSPKTPAVPSLTGPSLPSSGGKENEALGGRYGRTSQSHRCSCKNICQGRCGEDFCLKDPDHISSRHQNNWSHDSKHTYRQPFPNVSSVKPAVTVQGLLCPVLIF